MNTKLLTQTYNQLKTQHQRIYLLLGASLLLNLILSVSLFQQIGNERITIVPPVVSREFWVSADSMSDSGLEQMSDFFATLLLNVTPSSFAHRAEHLLENVDSSAYAALKSQLVAQQMEIERRGMTTSFHTTNVQPDRHKLLVKITGVLRVWVGNAPLDPTTKTYLIKYIVRQGRPYIQEFKEVPNA